MKGLLLALLATLVGLAMVAGGIYGLVQGDDDDEDSSSTVTTTGVDTRAPGFPFATSEQCEDAAARDPRLRTIRDFELAPHGKTKGRADVDVRCSGSTVDLTIRLRNLGGDDPASYFVWLYNNRKDAEKIGDGIGSGGTAFLPTTLDGSADTGDYEQIVVTRGPFGSEQSRPRNVIFAGSL